MDVSNHRYNFSNLIEYLELLLEETNNDKIKLEEQCEEALSIVQPWKMETPLKNNKILCAENQNQNEIEEVKENNNFDEIDEATNDHIDELIEQARNVRKQLKYPQEKGKNQRKSPCKKIGKLSTKHITADNNQFMPQHNQNCNGYLNLIGPSKSSKNSPNVQKAKEISSTPSTLITKNKLSKNNKSPYLNKSPHFQTTYQKQFSVVAKHSVKNTVKTGSNDNTLQVTSLYSREVRKANVCEVKNPKINLELFESNSQQIKCNKISEIKKEPNVKTVDSSCKNSVNIKIWNENYEDSDQKSLGESVNVQGLPPEVVNVLQLYHQYLNGIKSNNKKKEINFKSQFIEQFEKLNNADVNSESKSLLQEQIKKYLDLFISLNHGDKSLPQGNNPMFTSYGSVTKLKILEEKHLKLQKFKMQLNIHNIMLNEFKSANIDQADTISVFKTLRALCDLTTLPVPIIIKKD